MSRDGRFQQSMEMGVRFLSREFENADCGLEIVCMYVCMYVCMAVCKQSMETDVLLSSSECMYVCMYVCIFVSKAWRQMCLRSYECMYVCMYVCMCLSA